MDSQGTILICITIFLSLIIFQSPRQTNAEVMITPAPVIATPTPAPAPAPAPVITTPTPAPAPSPTYYPSATSAPALLRKICDKTSNPTFCQKTLKSDRRTSRAKDVLGVAKIALDLAVKHSTHTRDHINGLIKGEKPKFKPALTECLTEYNLIAASFRSALSEVEEGEYETANYDALIAADDAGYCETALANAEVRIGSVSKGIQITRYHSSIGDVVTTLLLE